MYTLELQAIAERSDYWEQRLKPERVNERIMDEEETEYWMSVFGEREFIEGEESLEPF